MDNFTYETPDEKSFFKIVYGIAKQNSRYSIQFGKNIDKFFTNGYCVISPTNNYSQKRWDAYYTEVTFYVVQELFFEISGALNAYEQTLKEICNTVMPADAGYDIMKINISPKLESNDENNFLEEITNSINYSNLNILSKDILEKGKSMSEVYVSLYCIENLLRNFIDNVLKDGLGNDYWDKCSINNDIKKCINNRRNEELRNKWLPLRGDNDLYYLDFVELSNIITNNWKYFKTYLPNQTWITSKIDELYKIRCLIAHNSYLGDDEKDCVKLYFKQIVKQISQFSKND